MNPRPYFNFAKLILVVVVVVVVVVVRLVPKSSLNPFLGSNVNCRPHGVSLQFAIRGRFHQHFCAAFMRADPKSAKNTVKLSVFYVF